MGLLDSAANVVRKIPCPGFLRKPIIWLLETKQRLFNKIPLPGFVKNPMNRLMDVSISVAKGD